MHPIRNIVLSLCVIVAGGVARADDQAAKDLLDKVMKAYGGADQSSKLSAISLKGKTSFSEGGMDINIAFDVSVQGLDTLRMGMEVNVGGMTKKMTMVLAAGKAWALDADTNKTEEAPKEVAPFIRQFLTAMRGCAHPVGLGDKEFTLAHGGEGKVNDQDAVILRVSRKDFNDITIYFDKKTHLPLKSETRATGPDNMEMALEFRFLDFKAVNGVQHPHRVKILKEGKDLAELEFNEIKVDQKFDANTFEKP